MTFTEYLEAFVRLMKEQEQIVTEVHQLTKDGTAKDQNPDFVRLRQRHRQLAKDIIGLNREFLGDGDGDEA